jgi:flagellar operon protein
MASNLVGALSQLIPSANMAGNGKAAEKNAEGKNEFASLLSERMEEASALQFSKHATSRLSDRNININENTLNKLERATDKAAEKGAKEALMMLDNLNFIVSVRNRTVVTAMPSAESLDSVYTNIDTAVIVGNND